MSELEGALETLQSSLALWFNAMDSEAQTGEVT